MILKEKTAQSILAPVGIGSNFGEVVALDGGGYMAVWVQLVGSILPVDGADDEEGTAIFARTFDAAGRPDGDVVQVNSRVEGFQQTFDLTVLKDGNVLVAWSDGPNSVDFDVDAKAAILRPNGKVAVKEFALSEADAGEQRIPHVYPLPDGGFYAAWADADSGDRWHGARFDADGQRKGAEVKLNVYGGEDGKLLVLKDGTKVLAGTSANFFAWQDEGEINPLNDMIRDSDIGVIPGDGHTGFESDMERTGADTFAVLRQDGFDVVLDLFRVDQTNPLDTNRPTDRVNVDPVRPADVGAEATGSLTLWDHETDSPIAGTPNLPTFARPETELVPLEDGDMLALYSVATAGSDEFTLRYTLYAQYLTADGTRLGDAQVIDDDFPFSAGGQINRPFGAQGDNGDVFLGWTTTTDRNGEGTVEITGGTYTLKAPGKTKAKQIGNGDDTVYGGAKPDKLDGKDGADVVYGLGGDDRIDATEGADSVYGGAGDDIVVIGAVLGGTGLQGVLDGGAGTDRLDLRHAPTGATIGTTLDAAEPGMMVARRFATRNFEEIVATDFDDVVDMTSGASTGLGNANDFKRAWLGDGDDTVTLYRGAQQVDGGDGRDVARFFQASTDVTIKQTKKAVVVSYDDPTFPQNDFTHRLTGIEQLYFFNDNETVKVGKTKADAPPRDPGFGGLNTREGNDAANKIKGKGGDDRLLGAGGKDTLLGKGGNDAAFGGDGNDRIDGAAGNDVLRGEGGRDKIAGGPGFDLLDGGDDNDILDGGADDDRLLGGAGKDKLAGGDGRDTLDGGAGNDKLTGGDGDDSFVFAVGGGTDTVTDFDAFGVMERDRVIVGVSLLDDDDPRDGAGIVAAYATVKKGDAVFDFGGGDGITLAGVRDLDALALHVSVDYGL